VVICSALGESNAKIAVQAMSAGAVGIVNKPISNGFLQKEELSTLLIDEIRAASRARIAKRYKPPPATDPVTRTSVGVGREPAPASAAASTATVLANAMQERQIAPKQNADVMLPPPRSISAANQIKTAQHIVVIGISTGGPQALEKMLPKLPAKAPGIVIVQHMPGTLTGAFAKRLNELSTISVKEAKDGDQIQPGQALVCPGSHHMMVRRSGVNYFVDIKDGPLVNRHRPSVDVLFRSAAACGVNVTAFLMTGMGDDGARGMKEMFDCGVHTVAQDEASCTVFGMPKEAIRLGAAKETLSLDAIAAKIAALVGR
jgi:two-component system chemotaxis response regulator CheB